MASKKDISPEDQAVLERIRAMYGTIGPEPSTRAFEAEMARETSSLAGRAMERKIAGYCLYCPHKRHEELFSPITSPVSQIIVYPCDETKCRCGHATIV